MKTLEELYEDYFKAVQELLESADEKFDNLYSIYENARNSYVELKKNKSKKIIKIKFD